MSALVMTMGQSRTELRIGQPGPRLSFTDSGNRERMVLEPSRFYLLDGTSKSRVVIAIGDDGTAGVGVLDRNGTGRAGFTVSADGKTVTLP
jgi:hypothetical protein